MDPNLSFATTRSRCPRILLVDKNVLAVESLVHRIRDERLDLDYDVCLSHERAIIKLFRSPPPYQLVISSVPMAEQDDFFLLKHNRIQQPTVPFVLTTGLADTASARRAIDEGAFDLLPVPLEPEQTAHTIRRALWHNKLKGLIATQERALETYRGHLAAYPSDKTTDDAFHRAVAAVQRTISVVESSMQRFEGSFECFSEFAKSMEQDARIRALHRLNSLQK